VIIERNADGHHVVTVPALRSCHTQASSLDELIVTAREAIELCLEEEADDVEPLDFVGIQRISIR
jgi:predicted RNase H-like HicB family nuclease